MHTLTYVDFIIVLVTIITVTLAVVIHHEVAMRTIRYIEQRKFAKRRRMLTLVFILIITHIAQIWMFAGSAACLLNFELAGSIRYAHDVNFLDLVYLSATAFTTLGFGDIVPEGSIRFLYGSQALTGFTLITWSASLTFLEMQKHWVNYIRD
ncbi:ion channel [Aliidiomarina sp.]|uniref:ion channel n=1 Tax=Aliidiomarina sp. TaxID=1872439 RepID=UPI003A4E0B23